MRITGSRESQEAAPRWWSVAPDRELDSRSDDRGRRYTSANCYGAHACHYRIRQVHGRAHHPARVGLGSVGLASAGAFSVGAFSVGASSIGASSIGMDFVGLDLEGLELE
ncbi:hypothetical protein [Salinibacterium sp.]|uniref:hypothetical protein n=1 Tax=Salinibacterium sp. TaxID=1915057 RepID=UPI00286A4A77|nr:hypothetical protein [Salinibacterium sp.]